MGTNKPYILKSKMSKGGYLPKYALGDVINNFPNPYLSADDPATKAIGYGTEAASALLPYNRNNQLLKSQTSAGRYSNNVDNAAGIATQFTPTKGLITKGGQQLGNSLENSIGGKAGAITGNAVKYGATGAEIGNTFGPEGAAIGAGIGTVYGGIEGAVEGNQMKAQAIENGRLLNSSSQQNQLQAYQSAIGQGFKSQGNADKMQYKWGGYRKYAQGGDMNDYFIDDVIHAPELGGFFRKKR